MLRLIKVLFGKPFDMTDKEIYWSIFLGCFIIVVLLVYCLIRGFTDISIELDILAFSLYLYAWLRIIPCEDFRLKKQMEMNKPK